MLFPSRELYYLDIRYGWVPQIYFRGIDFSIANQEVPNRLRELPSLIKKVCLAKNDVLLQPTIMVLMISVKGACQIGWFPDQDSEELTNLAKMIASKFSNASDFKDEPLPSHLIIPTVMSRFYPRLKMNHMFVSLVAKFGFEAYNSDFHLSKNPECSPGDKIRLFVVQTDSLETSSCLVTPAKVNFLLNGKGVEKRTSLYLDTGPQVPTVVTTMLKYGTNLLQAVGEFNGNFIIIVAFMSEVPNPDSSTLQFCEQPAPATVDADSDVIEGSSRISINCPISFKRIKTPVKGVSCKHIQCFDFDNDVDINSRRPSWRCPHCNQHVCFPDIRIDEKMVEVLNEVGPNVSNIIVSSDGSWNAVMESEDNTDKTLNAGLEEAPQPAGILDLTLIDDSIDIDTSDIQDKRHFSEATTQPMPSLYQSLQHSTLQRNRSSPPTQPPQQNASFLDPNQVPSMHRIPNKHQNSSPPVNLRIHQSRSQSPGAIQPSLQSPTSLLRPQGHAGVSTDRSVHRTGAASGQQSHLIADANRAALMFVGEPRGVPTYSWIPDVHNTPNQMGMSGATPSSRPVTGTDGQGSADMKWRPSRQMRGALSGQAYDEAFQRYINQPNQQAQATRPVSNATPLPNTGESTPPAFIGGQTVVRPSSASAVPVVRSAGTGSGISPKSSSAM